MRYIVIITFLLLLGAGFLYVAQKGGLTFGAPAQTQMDDYFLKNSQKQTGANNVVTAVVFDFRGFDTLGEAAVLFTAVLGVGAILRRLKAKEEEEIA